MERPVKERLIGAAVLMAAAIILIPEMLSGPGRDSAERQAQTTPSGEAGSESGIKTYTIDLSQSPGAQPPMPVETTDNRAPPPEVVASETPPAEQSQPEHQAIPESAPATAEPPAQSRPAPVMADTPRPESRTETPRPAPPKPEPQKEPQKTEPRAVASTPSAPRSTPPTATVPTDKGWAVQLGSYSSQATATRLMNEWRAKGQSAFVMPVATGGKTLYRVRIGPSKDRAGAEAVLKTVKSSVPGAAVVTHP